MEKGYPITIWKYKSRNPKNTVLVLARTREKADAIIDIENSMNIYHYKPVRFFGSRATTVRTPPYDLEQDQVLAAEMRKAKREKYFQDHPEDTAWLAKR